ncbi:DNA cytosine methyltransferase, partial [Stutzerimonas nosocomialis]|uniref:DNA cytosine methyltransferase n=1 Tax=Stutzerimonas nosocomialis TaxID=1056496 RepID=UPI0011080DEE
VCAVERNAHAAQILAQRQNDGALPPFPIWSDVCSFDGRPWRGLVDVVSGGFPCQDISNSGEKDGIEGARSGLWKEQARIIREVQPRFAYVENVAALLVRGIDVVLGDLAEMGFHARWGVLGTADTGGHQARERIWIVADAQGLGWRAADVQSRLLQAALENFARSSGDRRLEYAADHKGILRPTKPGLVRVADDVAYQVDRIRAIGNGQDPRVAAAAFRLLSGQE